MELEKIVYVPLAKLKFVGAEIDAFAQHLILHGLRGKSTGAVEILRSILVGNQSPGGGSFVVELEADDVLTLMVAAKESSHPLFSKLEMIHRALEHETERKNATDYQG